MNLSDARVLITGGAGLVGSTIADQLLAEDVGEIVVLDNLVRGRVDNLAAVRASGKLRLIEGDIRDTATVAAAMDGIDVLFHQAAIRITQCAEEPRLALDVLATGTFNVLEAAVAARVRKVVAASSASVYGLAESFPTTEKHHPYGNRTIYGAAKVFNEGLLRSFHEMHGLDYVALRYFNVYGPRMDVHGVYTEVLVRWMERIAAGQPPLILGDGTSTMDFVYIEDIARANLLAAIGDVTGEVFNVASGTETSLAQLAGALLDVMGSDLRPEHGPERKVNAVPRRLSDTSKARDVLGFEAKVSLHEGLSRLVDWWRAELKETA
ncbi:UDP-glucose 4-epimerase [Herbihabitans rhizosphaerae]|uniref:UDP-glucose 4-epimerase n=1 Tax=Herbihabitans rhizosphaerae TaxID=1872711 RepID=A0A4Q7KXA2_9PSEU|nr:NAD-dependent epimerase/dehydratase family protein [Herbihabitans rhizosphaerae]RZS40930.1 UDP-glucose 4-epimerase [Herbihabitans rhizosphaerae]